MRRTVLNVAHDRRPGPRQRGGERLLRRERHVDRAGRGRRPGAERGPRARRSRRDRPRAADHHRRRGRHLHGLGGRRLPGAAGGLVAGQGAGGAARPLAQRARPAADHRVDPPLPRHELVRPDALPPEVSAASVTPSGALPALLDRAAAAVLLVDLATTEVVYANDLAQAMAGRAELPLPIDTWGRLAGLADSDGADLAGSSAPLSQVCRGLPVAGELIRREPQQASRAAVDEQARQSRGSGLDVDDVTGPLWVTGFRLEGSGSL